MALNFPSSPVLNQTYQRWTWNGTAWVPTATVSVPMLPISGGVLTGNLGVQGTTALDGTLTAAGLSNLNTMQVNGQADFLDGVTLDGVDSADLATKTYVDEAVASGGLWQGTWDAANNDPDLTDVNLHFNGWTWAVVLADPTAPFVIPATPAIPGLSGQTVYNGDHVIWSATASAFEIVPGSSLSLSEAQGMFLAQTGGTLTGALTLAADPTQPLQAATKNYVDTHVPAASAVVTLQQAGAGSNGGAPRVFTLPVNFAVPTVDVYQLQSTDLVSIYYALIFNLTNLAAGMKKTVLLDCRQLYRPQFVGITPWGYIFDGDRAENRVTGSSIQENGTRANGWLGRENFVVGNWWGRNSGVVGYIGEGMRMWRNMMRARSGGQHASGTPVAPFAWRNAIGWTPLWNVNYGQWPMHLGVRSWYKTANQMDYRIADKDTLAWPGPKLINPTSNMTDWGLARVAMVKATFEYYGPLQKFMTFDCFFQLPRDDT